ncbi:MAG: carboxypeptidase regulatory-like domain-containing protein [Planctomycetota bacterium]
MHRDRWLLVLLTALAIAAGWWLASGAGTPGGDVPASDGEDLEAVEARLFERLGREADARRLPGLEARPRGEGVLRGTVLHHVPEVGVRPLTDVIVRVYWRSDAALEGPAAPDEASPEGRATARTDAEGTFVFQRLPAFTGGVLVLRHAPYRDVQRRGVHVRVGETTDLGEILLGAPTSLRGEVVDARGRPLEGARVQAFAARPGTGDGFDLRRGLLELQEGAVALADVEVDRFGEFVLDDLPPGTYTLRASARGHATAFRGGVVVSLDEHGSAVRMVLDEGAGFRGRVRESGGRGLMGARVIAVALPAGGEVRVDRVETTSGPDGVYELDVLVPGMRYFLEAAHPDHAPSGTFVVATTGFLERDFVLEASGRVQGVIRDAETGKPVPYAEVTLASGSLAGVSPLSTTADGAGQYVFPHAHPGPVLLFLARAPGFVQTDEADLKGLGGLVVEAGGLLEIDRELVAGGEVTGTVRDQAGRVVPYATVGLTERRARWRGERTTTTDLGGAYRLAGIRAGEHVLRVDATGYAPLVADADVKVVMPPAATSIVHDVVLDDGAVLTGRVRTEENAPVSGAVARVEVDGDRRARERVAGRQAVTHPDGSYRLGGLPAGVPITLVVQHASHAAARKGPYRLQAGQVMPVDITLDQGARLVGRAEDPDGRPIERARVRWGVVRPEDEGELRDAFRADALLGTRSLGTDALGGFVIEGLEPGRHVVKVEHEGYGTWYRHDVMVPAEDDPPPLVAVLQPALAIEGVVRGEGGGVAAGAFVYAREPRGDGEPRVADGRVRALVSGETDAAGRFRLEPLAPGLYEVVVWYAAGFVAEAQDHRDARVRKAGVNAGARNVVFELLPWPPPDPGGG